MQWVPAQAAYFNSGELALRFDISSPFGRMKAWLYAMFVEHNFTNIVRLGFYKISDGVYRSSQPTMWQLGRYAKKYGIKTILNLKGPNTNSAYYAFEVEKCRKLGIRLVDINIASRNITDVSKMRLAKEIFDQIEYPAWMHCKAGADRTGIYATLFQHFKLGMPIAQTDQLKLWPFGHIKHSQAGKFDYYLEKYLEYQQSHPEVGFLEWSETVADYAKMNKEFKPGGFANFINEYVLRRE